MALAVLPHNYSEAESLVVYVSHHSLIARRIHDALDRGQKVALARDQRAQLPRKTPADSRVSFQPSSLRDLVSQNCVTCGGASGSDYKSIIRSKHLRILIWCVVA